MTRISRMGFQAKLLADLSHKAVLDLDMPGYGRLLAVSGIGVDVVVGTVTLQVAARVNQLTKKFVPFQTSTAISLL